MLERIDQVLDRISMYRLVLYSLILFIVIASILSLFNLVPFSPVEIIFSSLFLVLICWGLNKIISKIFNLPTNVESAYITALILALIVNPAGSIQDYVLLFAIGLLATASKYLLVINKKQIFNPAAISVVLTSVFFGNPASWWVGAAYITPFVVICGLLIVRKLQFEKMIASFFVTFLSLFSLFAVLNNQDLIGVVSQQLINSPIFFFAFIMLTEPSTLPPTNLLRNYYGSLIGFLNVPFLTIGGFYFTPELSLVLGNFLSFLVGPRQNLILKLNEKKNIAKDMTEFSFVPNKKLNYSPGQYMEWTFPHKKTDARGNRRYFTLASSPTEKEIKLGIRFYENGSSFKKSLHELNKNSVIKAGSLGGDFILPRNKNRKIVFIAGGIGITPFRSMIKYLIDNKEKRNIVLLYSNTNENEVAYKEIFDSAVKNLGIKVSYFLTGENISTNWTGKKGRIDKENLLSEVPDFKERLFYISGSPPFVKGIRQVLFDMGIEKHQIKTDFFPGYV